MRLLRLLILAIFVLSSLVGGNVFAADATGSALADHSRGRLLAQSYCQLCHAVPDPAQLDRATWKNELLPKMKFMAGVEPPPTNGYFYDLEVLLAAKYFPEKPLIPKDVFEEISAYYIAAAPEKTVSIQDQNKIQVGLKQFSLIVPSHRRSPPRTTMLRIDPIEHSVIMGDGGSQGIDVLSPGGKLRYSLALGNIPTAMVENSRGFFFACVGHFFPRDQQIGQILFYEKSEQGVIRRAIGGLMPRLSDIQVADLNGDGLEDLVVCAYGNMLGRLSWFEAKGGTNYTEHILLDKPGSLRTMVRDLNGDGHPDIAVLVAQALESFMIFLGDGKGGFEKRIIFQRPPSWGHSGFEMADFNGDGKPDLLVTNGDNADFTTSPPRAHHGIRIYLNRGNLEFKESYFFPMNGAYRAVARDFDGDGDLDIAAISFFPDYEKSPRESFVYLENQAGTNSLEFAASTFRESITGRWLTLEAGDIDGDGDDDIVLGSLVEMPTAVPEFVKNLWKEKGPSVLVLRNTRK